MEGIALVGFDLDYTLAVYVQEEMDRLSIETTARMLVDRGYPDELATMDFRTDFPIRGLLVDKRLGNVLKMDRYRYVKKAFHGMTEIEADERRALYSGRRLRPGTARYHWVDSLYTLSEVALFAAAVEVLDRSDANIDYRRLFEDIRASIDLAHRDGTIPGIVLEDLPRYVTRDPGLAPTLHKLRSTSKRLFLLTNAPASFCEPMMSHLLDGELPGYATWRQYFDVVITSADKPGFFTGSAPLMELGRDGATRPARSLRRQGTYVGGNLADLERLSGVTGEQVLYIGDHIYGDVLRAKRETGWRTAMIVQEMTAELRALERCRGELARLHELEEQRSQLFDSVQERRALLEAAAEQDQPDVGGSRSSHRRAIDRLRVRLRETESEILRIESEVDQVFHPFWGSLFKAGTEMSSFGEQVEKYACIYTDRVSNLLGYSPMHYFRSPRAVMPHEL